MDALDRIYGRFRLWYSIDWRLKWPTLSSFLTGESSEWKSERSELKSLRQQGNTHRNKVCKFQLWYLRKIRVSRSSKTPHTFLHNHPTVMWHRKRSPPHETANMKLCILSIASKIQHCVNAKFIWAYSRNVSNSLVAVRILFIAYRQSEGQISNRWQPVFLAIINTREHWMIKPALSGETPELPAVLRMWSKNVIFKAPPTCKYNLLEQVSSFWSKPCHRNLNLSDLMPSGDFQRLYL